MERRIKIPAMMLRGGTSRGLYFLEKNIFPAGEQRDAFLLRAMGSPDIKQIDGMGGATAVTSKVAIVGPSSRPDADVDYTFAQVSIDKPVVSYRGNCGNILSGVGPFAVEQGLVPITEPVTTVRIHNTNTGKIIYSEVCVANGAVQYMGDTAIAGVPGTAAPVRLKFKNPAGTLGKGLLPTGNVRDMLDVPGFGTVEVSFVDAANPLVFVRAKDLGLDGYILPADIDTSPERLAFLERVRGAAALRLGLVEDPARSAWDSPTVPKLAMISPAGDYTAVSGAAVRGADMDIAIRMMSMQKAHPTCALTTAMCTAAACLVPGSIVQRMVRPGFAPQRVRIGHPDGVMEAGAEAAAAPDGAVPEMLFTVGIRTANLLFDGNIIYKTNDAP